MKTPVVIRDNYAMYLELYDNYLWFHTDINKWTSKIKQEFIKDLNTLQSLLPQPILALVAEDNKKLAKFGASLGWIKGNKVMVQDGSTAHIFYWSKQNG